MLVSNIRENGKLIGSLADGEMHFHSDFCYVEKPAKGTFLYAIEIPSEGGDTLFLNMYKAYEALPSELRRSSKAGRPSTPIITNRRPARSTRLRSTLPQVRTMRSRSFAHTPTRDARRCTSIG